MNFFKEFSSVLVVVVFVDIGVVFTEKMVVMFSFDKIIKKIEAGPNSIGPFASKVE